MVPRAYSFMVQKISMKFRWNHAQRGRQMLVGYLQLRFSTGRELEHKHRTAETLSICHAVFRVNDGALAE